MAGNDRAIVLKSCSEEDGTIYLGPISTAAFSCSGMFWNEELFARAGIEEFPDTWEGFWDCCKSLRTMGSLRCPSHRGNCLGAYADRHSRSGVPRKKGRSLWKSSTRRLIRMKAACA